MRGIHLTQRRSWTIREEQVLEQKCSEGKGYKEIGKLLNRSSDSCQNKARGLNIKSLYKPGKKYDVNKDFWKPNDISAYWAGFSAADASIQKHSANCYHYKLEISTRDENHLELLKRQCDYTGPIHRSLREEKFWHSRIIISEPQWTKDLEKYYNIIPNKTLKLMPPNLESEYLKYCYLIGYLDGDGTIFLNKTNNNGLTIKVVSGSMDIIQWLHKLIYDRFEHCSIRTVRNYPRLSTYGYPTFDVNGVRAAVVFDYLSKFDVPKMDRKWKDPDVLNFVSQTKEKYPQFFNCDYLCK